LSLKQTPLNAWHRAHGGTMVDFGGWDMPVSYGPIGPEHVATRTAAGLFDIGHMGQVLVSGAKSLEYLQHITTNDVAALGKGRMQYSLLPNAQGGLHDDIIVSKLDDAHYYVVVNASNTDADLAWMQAQAGAFGVKVELWVRRSMFALQGPKADLILDACGLRGLDALHYYHLREDRLGGEEILLSRSGYTGEDGFELSVDENSAPRLWDLLMGQGAGAGIKPVGLGARNTLRLEMGYALYGHEIDAQSNPYEAGLGWVIKPAKGDFIGKAAMLAAKDAPQRKLTGFKLLDRGVARDGYSVVDAAGAKIGHVTSGAPSPSLDNACVGLAYVPAALAAPGSEILIDVRGRSLKAVTQKPPFVPSKVRKN
jgi:aminomethyltransferase